MKTPITSIFTAAAIGLWAGVAGAHHIAGSVMCTDVSPAVPLAGVTVSVQGAAETYSGVTEADGTFYIGLPVATDTYTVTIAAPSGTTVVAPASGQYVVPIFANGEGGPDQFNSADFEVIGCTQPSLGKVGDTVYCDENGNGAQDPGEAVIPGVTVMIVVKDAAGAILFEAQTVTDANGKYLFTEVPEGLVEVTVDVSTVAGDCSEPSCPTQVIHLLAAGEIYLDADFCFTKPPMGPGTGTPGYWKNHPEAWPVDSITIGQRTYAKSNAIRIMGRPADGDKTYNLFKQLVAAKLNVLIGNESACIAAQIATADAWMAMHPVGSGVAANSTAWKEISGVHTQLDQYNNGMLCAPHRN